jgi:hypothetical protein
VGFYPSADCYNHASAVNFPNDIKKYIDTELKYGALVGLIETSHFDFIHFSLFMSRPKDADSQRVIVDLSWQKGSLASVNSCVAENIYVNVPFSLKLPTIDTICSVINAYKQPVVLFKIDLARAFRQIPINPLDVSVPGAALGMR